MTCIVTKIAEIQVKIILILYTIIAKNVNRRGYTIISRVLDAHLFQYSESNNNNEMNIENISRITTSPPVSGKIPEGNDL
ncbi:MAG: hypothetical protein ABII90_01865 [Bacteroidota bacterium]